MEKLVLCLSVWLGFAASGLSQMPGQELWHVLAPHQIYSSPAVSPDGTIYVGTTGGSLCSFSAPGRTNWVLSFSGGIYGSPSIGPDGRVYAAARNGVVAMVTPTGAYSTTETGGYIYASPAIGSDGTVYVCSISNFFNKLFAMTPDGAVKWVFNMTLIETNSYDFWSLQASSPAIGPQGTIYVGSIDKNLYSINPDGTTNWVFPLTAPTYASPAIGPDGTIYIGADNGTAYAINPKGEAKWQVHLCDRWIESSAAVGTDGTVYFPTGCGQICALDPNGSQKWVIATQVEWSGSPALASDGSIYIAESFSTVGAFHAFSPPGRILWTYYTSIYQSGSSSPAIGPDGTIYLTAGNGLYALYGTNGLMQSSWPMFRRNPAHTGRVIQRGMAKPQLLADGNFGFNVNVETGRTYQVEYSTNLLDWTKLTNFVSEALTNQVVDTTATNARGRFYRLSTATE